MTTGTIGILLVVLLVLLVLPAVLHSYAITVFTFIFFYAYLGQAWNIVGGYAGQLSAGHAAFVGIGAYTAATLPVQAGPSPRAGMVVRGGPGAGVRAGLGVLRFRLGLRRLFLVLLPLA